MSPWVSKNKEANPGVEFPIFQETNWYRILSSLIQDLFFVIVKIYDMSQEIKWVFYYISLPPVLFGTSLHIWGEIHMQRPEIGAETEAGIYLDGCNKTQPEKHTE